MQTLTTLLVIALTPSAIAGAAVEVRLLGRVRRRTARTSRGTRRAVRVRLLGRQPQWEVDEVHTVVRRWRRRADRYDGDRLFVTEAVVPDTAAWLASEHGP